MSNMIEILEQWQKHILSTDAQIFSLQEMFNCVECPLIDAFEKLQIDYTEAIAEKVGDDSGWLMWFWLDNDMGKAELDAGRIPNHVAITSLQQLEQLILQCGREE